MASALRPQVAIVDPSLTVEPGRRVATRIRIRNTGRQVAHYRLDVVEGCVPAAWATIANTEVKLNPGADTDVVVHFAPPIDTQTRAGTFPYGIRVQPGPDDGQMPMVGEADLTVGAITAVEVGLRPKQSAGRFSGKHRVLLANKGTEDLQVRLRVFDDDEKLSTAVVPQTVTVPAGGHGEALLRVRARTPKLLGKPEAVPFHVAYRRRAGSNQAVAGPTDGGEVEATVDGTYGQKPIVAKWMILVALLAMAIIGYLVWSAMQRDPGPGTPPAPPALTGEPQSDGMVELEWESEAHVDTVLLRTIDCETRADPVPLTVGEPVEVNVVGSPRKSHVLGTFPVGEPLCFQARAVDRDGQVSVWSDVFRMALSDAVVPAPSDVQVLQTGPGTAEVSWDEIEHPAGEVRYDVLVDNRSYDPNGFLGSPATLQDLPAGDHEIRVQALLPDDERSLLSDPQTVTILPSEDADEPPPATASTEDGRDATPSVPETTVPLRTPQGHFVVILPEGGRDGALEEGEVPFALSVARTSGLDQAGHVVVGRDIELPPNIPSESLPPDIIFQDGFDTLEEAQQRCQAYREEVDRIFAEEGAGALSGLSRNCTEFAPASAAADPAGDQTTVSSAG